MIFAHISDLHLTTVFTSNNIAEIEMVLDYVKKIKADHLIITGDLTDNAAEEDFFLLRNLFNQYGFLNSKKLSLIIGNHDIFGGVQVVEDIFTFSDKCGNVNYPGRIKEFYNYFRETFDDCIYFSKENIFPYAKNIGDALLIGVNSIAEYSKIKNPFASNGSIDQDQFQALTDILRNCRNIKHKLILTHHHFNKIRIRSDNFSNDLWKNVERQMMKLKKKKRLFNLFKQYNVDLVCHGHYHESEEYSRNEIRFSNAGASFKNSSKDVLNVNVISLNNGKIDIEIHHLMTKNFKDRLEGEGKKILSDSLFKIIPAMNFAG